MTSTREATVLEGRSEAGIGRAPITPSGSRWPGRRVLRFHLQDLEGIEMDNGRWKLGSFLGSDTAVPYVPAGPEEAASPEGTDPTVDLPVTRDGEVIQVVVPSLLLDERYPELRIQWVDFYRR
jgi:hypothetical protein